jgi:hypothetical protein
MLIYLCSTSRAFISSHNLCFIALRIAIFVRDSADFTVPFHLRVQASYDNTKDFSLKIKTFCSKDRRENIFLLVAFQEFRCEMLEMWSRHRSLGLGEAREGARLPPRLLRLRPVRPTAINR